MIDEKYKDIINLPHHESKNHKHMSRLDRASQFAPFAALTGYESSIEEKARIVSKSPSLTEEEKLIISNKINYLIENKEMNIDVKITYFIKDKTKDGGVYKTINASIIKIDEIKKTVKLSNKDILKLDSIINIESNLFD